VGIFSVGTGRNYLWFVLLALIPQLLGHSSINWHWVSFSGVSVSVLLGEPIGSTILAVILLHEIPGWLRFLVRSLSGRDLRGSAGEK